MRLPPAQTSSATHYCHYDEMCSEHDVRKEKRNERSITDLNVASSILEQSQELQRMANKLSIAEYVTRSSSRGSVAAKDY